MSEKTTLPKNLHADVLAFTTVKPKFYTAYNVAPSIAEPECLFEKDELVYDETQEKLVKTGTNPFYKEIQSHYESTRLDYKIEQFRRGNTLALGVPVECDVDVSNVPTNLAEVLSSRQKAAKEFAELPERIRNVFGNSFDVFSQSLADGSYEGKISEYARGVIKDTRDSLAQPGSSGNEGGSKE